MTAHKPIPGEVQLPGYESPEVEPLAEWWERIAREDLKSVLPKLSEYGSFDLVAIGTMLCHALKWEDATLAQKTEIGCLFYAQGKLARAWDALREHRLPSDDSIYDLVVYGTMIRRIRETGVWK